MCQQIIIFSLQKAISGRLGVVGTSTGFAQALAWMQHNGSCKKGVSGNPTCLGNGIT